MENSLKQRIVGAVVLIALAVIFLPAVLKEKAERKPFESQIPAKPISLQEHQVAEEVAEKNKQISSHLDKIEQQARKNKVVLDSDEQSEQTITKVAETQVPQVETDSAKASPVKKETTKKLTADKPVIQESLGDAFKDAAWVVKVASFSNLDNAKKMVSQLKQKGYKAYRRSGKNQQAKTVYRIYVGPYIEKSRANAQLDNISKLSQSKAMLLVFDPTKH